MITELDARLTHHIIMDSGAADIFRRRCRGMTGKGDKPTFDYAVLLLGMFLTVRKYKQAHIRKIHEVLTKELPREWQVKWGVIRLDPADPFGPPLWTLSEANLQYVSKRVSATLDHTPQRLRYLMGRGMLPKGTDLESEREARKHIVEDLVDRIVGATLTPRPVDATIYALDATGLHTAELRGKEPDDLSSDDVDADEPTNQDPLTSGDSDGGYPPDTSETDEAAAYAGNLTARKRQRPPSDAAWGKKTHKNGKKEGYKGFALHALVRTPTSSKLDGDLSEPPLLEIFRLTSPAEDIVDVSLSMLDSVMARGQNISEIIGDKHYSFKLVKRWLSALVERNISQVLDLRASEIKTYTIDGAAIVGGWVHCPRTPSELLNLTRPSPSQKDPDVEESGLTQQEKRTYRQRVENFMDKITQRRRYAAHRIEPITNSGRTRWQCPAQAGTVGCSLVDGSIQAAAALQLPIVQDPPSPEAAPPLCTQSSISINAYSEANALAMKPYQRFYWGSKKWLEHWNRRTYVEGWFGTFKGDSSAGKKRGSSLYNGLPMVYLEAACFAAQANDINLTAFHRSQGGQPNEHPLLGTVEETHSIQRLTEDERLHLDAYRKARAANEIRPPSDFATEAS